MAIRARTSDRRQGNLTARTWAVYHHHRTADALFKGSGIAPRVKIRCPAGGEADNDFNGSVRPTRLRQGRRGQKGAG